MQPQFTQMQMQPQFTSFNPYQQQMQEAAQVLLQNISVSKRHSSSSKLNNNKRNGCDNR
ncbi:hypothetical protein MPER_15976 [Moniliophthora perniciosa FA553]|nr:hypothetical protein MPER_15976 [Moniliophthora perniciosa FA553]